MKYSLEQQTVYIPFVTKNNNNKKKKKKEKEKETVFISGINWTMLCL